MPIDWARVENTEPPTEVTYARGRLPSRIYLSATFPLRFESSRDFGHQARYATRVFDLHDEDHDSTEGWEWVEMEMYRSPKGRVQIKAMVAREEGAVRQIKIEKVPQDENAERLEPLVTLDRDRAQGFIEFIKALEFVPVDGEGEGLHLDEQLMHEVFRDPSAMTSLYERDPEQFRSLIRDDESAHDLVALAHRREVLQVFRSWLEDDSAFNDASEEAGGPERAWQRLFETNPWILGIGLGGQLLTSWSDERLEQVVGGFTVEESGKRIDALLRTQGSISSMVLAEIKHHKCDLLHSSNYRPGCWGPSRELSGGIVQAQQTAYRASRDLSEHLADRTSDGSDLHTGTFVLRPRNYLIAGSLDEMIGESGGVHRDKFRSFELHRRNLYEPELLTFDEVLARAEWQVTKLDREFRTDPDAGVENDQAWADPEGSSAADDPWAMRGVGWEEPPF
jgi:hypothetical protein